MGGALVRTEQSPRRITVSAGFQGCGLLRTTRRELGSTLAEGVGPARSTWDVRAHVTLDVRASEKRDCWTEHNLLFTYLLCSII